MQTMQPINKILPKIAAANPPPPNKSLMPQDMNLKVDLTSKFKKLDQQSPERLFLLRFWLRMGEAYRQIWIQGQGTLPSDLWATYLLKIGEKRATSALIDYLKEGNTYPPTLGEFIAISKPLPAHYKITRALPPRPISKNIRAIALKNLSQLKKTLGHSKS